jgi:hypothetical protein
MFLVQECNEQDWENPFECPNGRICTSIGITEKSVIDARNRLKQLGLIDFENGVTKQKSPRYYLLDYWNKVSIAGGNGVSIPVSNRGGNEVNISKNKPNETETKPNQSFSGAGAPGKRKKVGDGTEHWKAIVDTWFKFYQKKFSLEPTFNQQSAKALKCIVETIEKSATKAGKEWTEEYCVSCLENFFTKAHNDQWLRDNYLLPNLWSKFDSIVKKREDGNNKEEKNQPRGTIIGSGPREYGDL